MLRCCIRPGTLAPRSPSTPTAVLAASLSTRRCVPQLHSHHHLLSRRSLSQLTGAALLTLSLALSCGVARAQQQPAASPAQQQQQQAQQQTSRSMGTHVATGAATGASQHKQVPRGLRSSQDDLVDHLIRARLVKTARVAEALRSVDRGQYISTALASHAEAYEDHPLAIGGGQTISAPHMHAICLELLEPYLQPGARVLDVGAGSGYLTAALAKLVSPGGYVLGVEKVPELVVHAHRALAAANPELLAQAAGRADAGSEPDQQQPLLRLIHGNVLGEVLAAEAPFDAIHVGAAADELHQLLLDKLAPGGRMVIPVGPRYSYQVLTTVDKDAEGGVRTEGLMDVGYVPLTRPSELEDGQLP